MRYSYLIALATWVAMPTVSTQAEEPTADQRLAAGRDDPGLPLIVETPRQLGVFTEGGLAHFRLQQGQLRVDPMRYRKGSESFSGDGFEETLHVACSAGVPSVCYRFKDRFQRIQLIAEHGDTLRIESTLVATGERAVLTQDDAGNIFWSTRRKPAAASQVDVKASGPTLLHIIGHDEPGFRLHLEGLLARMLRGRSLLVLARQTEAHLIRHRECLPAISRDRVGQMVTQLGDRKSSMRRAAMHQLAKLGSVVTPHLTAALERSDLDTEQKVRIETLLSRSKRCDADTPASLACLLSADRAHWQLMADRMDHSEWLAANEHVRRCGLDVLKR